MAKRKHRKGNQRPLKKTNPAMRATQRPVLPAPAAAQRIASTPQPAADMEAQSTEHQNQNIIPMQPRPESLRPAAEATPAPKPALPRPKPVPKIYLPQDYLDVDLEEAAQFARL